MPLGTILIILGGKYSNPWIVLYMKHRLKCSLRCASVDIDEAFPEIHYNQTPNLAEGETRLSKYWYWQLNAYVCSCDICFPVYTAAHLIGHFAPPYIHEGMESTVYHILF